MALQYSTAHRTAAMDDIVTKVGTSGKIKIFTGTVPATCATADTGSLLVTFTGNASQFGTTSAGVLTVSAIANAVASGTGTAGYFRIYPSSDTTTNAVVQGSCATSGSDMNMTSTSITSGQTVVFTSQTITAFGA